MNRLYFYGEGPQVAFRLDRNVTVRNGHKWAKSGGTEVELWIRGRDNRDHHVGYGRIDSAHTLQFECISEDFLSYEHNPLCRTKAGLKNAMDYAYPPKEGGECGWGPEVTVLVFHVTHLIFSPR